MKRAIWMCAVVLLWTGVAGALLRDEINNTTHVTVGKVRPMLYGVAGANGELRPGDWLVVEGEPMYVVFQTDSYMDSRSSAIQYFTFYLRPQGDVLEDVTIRTGAYYREDDLATELPTMETNVIAVVTKEEQQAYFDKYPCPTTFQSFTHLSRACEYMPVTLPVGVPPHMYFLEDAGMLLRVYLISTEGTDSEYWVLDGYDSQQAVRNGLGLSMMPLERLSTVAEATCQGYLANIVGSKNDTVLMGSEKQDVIVAMGENNIVYGRGGADLICILRGGGLVNGGPDNDEIYNLSNKSMVLIGAGGNDYIEDGSGSSSIIGGPGSDVLRGNGGNDTLRGLDGNDRLHGGSGLDICDGGRGRNKLFESCELKR